MNGFSSTSVCPVSVNITTLHSNTFYLFMISGGFSITSHSDYFAQHKESASSDVGKQH